MILGVRSYHKDSSVSGLDYDGFFMPATRFSPSVTVAAIIDDGGTPLQLARARGYTAMVQMLQSAGAR